GRPIAAVGLPLVEKPLDHLPIAVHALRLEIGTVGAADLGALVPIQAEPAEGVEDRRGVLRRAPLLVGVLDSKYECASMPSGVEPVVERGARTADVQAARGRRGEANPGMLRHVRTPWAPRM